MSNIVCEQSQGNTHLKRILGEDYDFWSRIIAPGSKYYALFENIHDVLSDNDDDGDCLTFFANYLNEDRWEIGEKAILAEFKDADIGNQIFVYGSLLPQPMQDSDDFIVKALFITTHKMFVKQYATDDEEHDFEYYYYVDWTDIASVKLEYGEDEDSSFFNFYDREGEERFFIDTVLLGDFDGDNDKLNSWLRFFKEVIGHYSNSKSTARKTNGKTGNTNDLGVDSKQTRTQSSVLAKEELSTQKEIETAYNKLLDILGDANEEISDLYGVNSQFNNVKQIIESAFKTKMSEARNELRAAMKDTVWDNLVIAFFGETNAGKSTIIETFRILFDENRKKEDGLIVGDGRHDFTKTYEEYQLSISGHHFTLIDVPGIEGDETDFKDVIKTALHKAHCVFYVQGHNKKPDRATAEKIKKYLGDWVKVYSIYNVRGGVSNYDEEEERETLLTEGVQKTENLIKTEFKSILGDVYAGHITLQGLLAMSSKAEFSEKREDLIRGQQKLLSYFDGSPDKVLQFSQFKTLTNLVEQKAGNFKTEIIEANKQKLISLASRIADEMEQMMDSQNKYLSSLRTRLDTVKRDVCYNGLDSAKRNIGNKCKNAVDKTYGDLKADIFNLIENEPENIKEQAQHRQEIRMNELGNVIKSIVSTELSKVQSTANRKIKELDGIKLRPISFRYSAKINLNIDFTEALEELDVDWNDVANWVGKTAGTAAAGAALGSFIPGIGTLIGAAGGAIIGGIAHACSGDGGKADARKSASDAIEKAKQKVKNNISSMLSSVLNEIDSQGRKLKSSIDKEKSNIDELQDNLENFDEDVRNFVKRIKHKQYGRI